MREQKLGGRREGNLKFKISILKFKIFDLSFGGAEK
jgi:hypothetical protein